MAGNGKSWVVIVATLICAGTCFAQGPGVSRQEFEALKSRLDALETENANLKTDLEAQSLAEIDRQLEDQLNVMSANFVNGAISTRNSKSATVGGEIRTRGTYGFGELENEEEISGGYTAALVRLIFAFEVNENVKAQISADSVWSFGQGSDSDQMTTGDPYTGFGQSPSNTALRLHEAWIETNNTFGVQGLNSRTGRQEIHLGWGFQFGSSDWFDGYTHDGTIISYGDTARKWSLAFAAITANTEDQEVFQANSAFFTEHDFDAIYAVYFSYMGAEQVSVDAYVIHVTADRNNLSLPRFNFGGGLPANGAAASHTTFGTRLSGVLAVGEGSGVRYNAEFAYQTGEEIMPGLDIEGYTVEIDLRFKMETSGEVFDVFARFLFANGPEDGETGYVPLFTDRHSNYSENRPYAARYGLADLFPLANVFSGQVGVIFQLDQKITLGTTVLYAEADQALTAGDDAYGWEWDLWGRWQHSEQLTFTAGGALVFPDDQGAFIWGLSDETQFLFFFQARLLF